MRSLYAGYLKVIVEIKHYPNRMDCGNFYRLAPSRIVVPSRFNGNEVIVGYVLQAFRSLALSPGKYAFMHHSEERLY